MLFNHDTRHEGEVITKGIKYILRTEVVFKRESSLPSSTSTSESTATETTVVGELEHLQKRQKDWKNDPQYKEVLPNLSVYYIYLLDTYYLSTCLSTSS